MEASRSLYSAIQRCQLYQIFVFICFTVTEKKKIILQEKYIVKTKMVIPEISIIILICRKLRSVGPVQQKIKLPLPNATYPRIG